MQMKSVKRHILRVIAFVMALCLIAVTFTGCGKGEKLNAYRSVSGGILESQVLATNSDYELSWDSDAKAVLYKNINGTYWSDVLYQTYLDGNLNVSGSSPISITVVNTQTLNWDTYTSSSEIESNGSILYKKIDNGIRITFFFEKYKIAIPVDYVLEKDSIKVSIDSSKILEDGKDYKLVSISFLPNMCSVENTAENANLFVPTGTGAVVSAKETSVGYQKYNGDVYGFDLTSRNPTSRTDYEEIRLPVFGAYSTGKGLFGIIEQGIGAAKLYVEAANNRSGYSRIYPTFFVRGYDTFAYEHYGKPTTAQRVNEEISNQTFSVSYYPLYGEEADYNGMANKYRSYLIEKGQLNEKANKVSPYSVTFLGGTNTTESFFGIPYKKIVSLTTFSQIQEILEQLKSNNGILPTVRLLGYSDNGLRPGTIAGGSKYQSVYGSKKELKSVIEYCKDSDIFLDFDIVTFSKSGFGFSLNSNVAKTVILYDAITYPTTPTRKNDESNPYYLLSRDSLVKAANKALKKANNYTATGVSFGTLGKYAYSDYTDEKYYTRNGIEEEVASILANTKKEGYSTAVSGGNSYAACAADVIFDVSITSGDYDTFDYEVPFYQMVFHSYRPMYTKPVNYAANYKRDVAKAVAYGMGLGYDITNDYVNTSDDLGEYKFYATLFKDNEKKINDTLIKDKFVDYYNAVADSKLVKYELINNQVAKSIFENGVVIYTNLSDEVVTTEIGELQPYEYKLG